MGKGDKKTVRGKIIMGSYGANRKKHRTPAFVPPVVVEKKPVSTPDKEEKSKKETVEKVAKVADKTEKKPVAKVKKPAAKKKAPVKPKEKKEE